MKEELTEMKQLNTLSDLEGMSLSNDMICDVETGICGPVDNPDEKQSTEENKDANNDMV